MADIRRDVFSALNRLLQAKSRKPGTLVRLNQQTIIQICELAKGIIFNEPPLIDVQPCVHVVGDLHGQFYDLLRIFDCVGFPPDHTFLFLGNYVDRGTQSIETMTLLLAYKILHPEHIYLLRGNPECAEISEIEGFKSECVSRYSMRLWKIFIEVFNVLPIAASIGGKIFATHAGISPEITNLQFFDTIHRPIAKIERPIFDLMWSDPNELSCGLTVNPRSESFCFGLEPAHAFLDAIGHEILVRGHQMVVGGFEFPFDQDRTVVSLYSAPCAGFDCDSFGAVMTVSETFECSFAVIKPMERRMSGPKIALSPIDQVLSLRSASSLSRSVPAKPW
jgi:serine/threonine-protein phosphatase PP1 catalytic subunit